MWEGWFKDSDTSYKRIEQCTFVPRDISPDCGGPIERGPVKREGGGGEMTVVQYIPSESEGRAPENKISVKDEKFYFGK